MGVQLSRVVGSSRMVGWHQVEWLDDINLEVEVLRATAMAWCWLAHGLPRGSQSVSKDGICLRPPQVLTSSRDFIHTALSYSGCEDFIPYGKESIVEAEEEHYTVLTNGDRALNRYCVIGCCLQVRKYYMMAINIFFNNLLL